MRVLVALADKCNYSCVTCYQSESQNFAQFDLSSSDLGRLADLFEYAFQVSIGGFGEPLLSPAASGVLTAAKSSGAKTSITTNGSMVRRISGLALDRIEVSLDAVTADLLNSIRRGADIRVIYDNLAALSDDERAKVAFNVVVTKLNVREITLIVALAHRLGLGEVCLQTFNPYLPWHADMILTKDDLDVLDAQVSLANDLFAGPTVIRDLVVRENSARSTNAPAPAVLEAIGEIPYPRHAKPDDRDVVDGLRSDYAAFAQRGASFLQYLTNNRDRILAYYRLDAHENASGTATDRSVPYCMEPFGTMVVNADGSVNPCCKLTWPMGNINDDSIDAIWNGERFRELRTTVLTRENLSPVCQGCRDANRFANLPLMLVAMKEQGGIPDVAVPDDLHLPPSIANLSDVRELLGEPAS
jgi:radical SAM protein with 4Fe4S-binding SPASM domain